MVPAASSVALALVLGACSFAPSTSSTSATPPSPSPGATPTPSPPVATEWTEYHHDSARAGQGPVEPPLSSPKVAWSISVDGDVYASPLIVAGHVIVATENNTVYSLDIFTGATIWKTHLGTPVDAATLPCGDIGPSTGITGTPAADSATGRLYVVAYLQSHHHMLFALSLVDGSVVSQQDVDPVGSTPAVEQQRGALAIGSGFVYIPLGGMYGDCGAYHGYVVAVPVAGGQSFAFRVPAARGAGIWSAQGVTIGPGGDVYAVTGNAAPASSFADSNSVLELSSTLQLKSYFAPSNWASLDATDTDLGALGATVVTPAGLVVAVGKDGVAYLMRAGQLGGIGGQVASRHVCAGAYGGTSWSPSGQGPQGAEATVFVPCVDGLFALAVNDTSVSVAWHVPHPALGSPILAAGALWAIEPASATLFALDPSTGAVLYSTGLTSARHFTTPAATEGFVVAPAGRGVLAVVTTGA
jgi:outer membrane protein assembly factor BamB